MRFLMFDNAQVLRVYSATVSEGREHDKTNVQSGIA